MNPADIDKPIGYGAFGVVWSVKDPRDGKRVALKKMPNVFQNSVSAKRVLRELKMLCYFKHLNILSAVDILLPSEQPYQEMYVITPLMHTDLHKIIVSPQQLTTEHVKLFLYQLLRGLKYLHAAHILHRDIKPGNLLVNTDCLLKICDFGLARVAKPDESKNMTQEVVTQYYRAPELLMGVRNYSSAIDIWSVGCIFAELLSRKILFPAESTVYQVDMIYNLLKEDTGPSFNVFVKNIVASHCIHTNVPIKSPTSPHNFYSLCANMTHEASHLLSKFLSWDPEKRILCDEALQHVYLRGGRLNFHTSLCHCCHVTLDQSQCSNVIHMGSEAEMEPRPAIPFSDDYEKYLRSVDQVKTSIVQFVNSQPCGRKAPLCINTESSVFAHFAASTVAHSQPSTSTNVAR